MVLAVNSVDFVVSLLGDLILWFVMFVVVVLMICLTLLCVCWCYGVMCGVFWVLLVVVVWFWALC